MMLVAAVMLAGPVALMPRVASAEGLFDFFFGGAQKQQQRQAPAQANFFADPFGLNQQPAPPKPVATAGSGPAFCVRSCDGRYFPISSARRRQPGADVPGVLSGKRHQGVLRQHHRRRVLRRRRTLCRQRKRLCLSQGVARGLHLQRPRSRRPCAGGSDARQLAARRRRRRHHQWPRGLYRRPARRRPDRGFHPGRLLSRPDRGCPRPARRDEGSAGDGGNRRQRRAARTSAAT